MIKAAIFDMDGVLIDSEPFWRRAHIETLAKEGFSLSESDVRRMAGVGTAEVVERWRQRFGWKHAKNPQIEKDITHKVFNQVRDSGRVLIGVYPLIKLLKAHEIRLAVASSSPPKLINEVLEKLQLKEVMDIVHSAREEKRGKPFPDVFLSVAKALELDPEECVVFEDSANGVKAAKSANMVCIAIPERPHNPSEFGDADIIVESLKEVDWEMLKAL